MVKDKSGHLHGDDGRFTGNGGNGSVKKTETTAFDRGVEKSDLADLANTNSKSSITNDEKKLDTIVGGVSHFTNDKNYDVADFRNTLEKNGFPVDYVENKSGTWKDHNGEKNKEYDIKLKDGRHIYFNLIADNDYNTKEVIAYVNGKGW